MKVHRPYDCVNDTCFVAHIFLWFNFENLLCYMYGVALQ